MIGKIHEKITNEHFSSLTDENQKKDKMYMIKSNNFSQELENQRSHFHGHRAMFL